MEGDFRIKMSLENKQMKIPVAYSPMKMETIKMLKSEDVRISMKKILKIFHRGTLYEGESIDKIIIEEIGEDLI